MPERQFVSSFTFHVNKSVVSSHVCCCRYRDVNITVEVVECLLWTEIRHSRTVRVRRKNCGSESAVDRHRCPHNTDDYMY